MPLGPVELLVVQFPGNEVKGDIVPAIKDLVDKGTIRVIDILFIKMEQQQVTQRAANQAQAELEQMKAQLAAMQAQQLQADQARATTAAAPSTQPDLITQL